LANRKYKSAAKYFLQVSCDHCDFSDIVSPNNVAVYAGLCALATFERDELQEKVMSSRFVGFLIILDFIQVRPQMTEVYFNELVVALSKCSWNLNLLFGMCWSAFMNQSTESVYLYWTR
jgi:hypothetical protein